MVTTGFTTAGMVICLGITVGILVYGAANKFKINDGEHPALWRVLFNFLVCRTSYFRSAYIAHSWLIRAGVQAIGGMWFTCVSVST